MNRKPPIEVIRSLRKEVGFGCRDEEGYLLLNIHMLIITGEERAIIEDNIWLSKGNPVDLVSPPSGKLLCIDYKNGDHIKIDFFELKDMQDLTKRYPDADLENRLKIKLPITVVEISYKVGGAQIEFGPNDTKLGGFVIKGLIAQGCRCAISL